MPDKSARGGLHDLPFDYQEMAGGKVIICWRGKSVCLLKGREAVKFLSKAESQSGESQQLLMAKVTRNFKRGNERP